jgi:tetratricopeptide (TPR) repeat protein/predicted Ser/Thr protein kinase
MAEDPIHAGRPPSLTGFRPAEVPRAIGPFRIERKLGEGGMGVVYLARQEHPTRKVALKVIHVGALSPRTLRRFEHEGEMLGRLQHPGIAQIHQAGTYSTEHGVLPYFAMEYVEGERLDHFVRQRELSIRARLELMALVADAIEHAHQKSVIHRDLKPGNILVTAAGQPKILDFGVARLNDDETRTTTLRTDMGALLGTLPYMSPEQAGGDPRAIDTRSDVYSLGVLLYELLTGKLPYLVDRGALPDAVRVIQEEEPSKLSTHDRALRGDVETIVQKALEKDRERRYPTAQALADDIRRHLADEPILARPPSAGYQLSKFARRNKALVGAAAAVLLTSLAGAAVSTRLYLRERAAHEGARPGGPPAETQQARAEKSAAFLLSLFDGLHPRVAQGADTTLLASILGDARARLEEELAGQPDVEAELRGALGTAYIELNLLDDAEAELRRAHALVLAAFGAEDRRTLRASQALAYLHARRGELRAAEELQRATLEQQTAALGASDADAHATERALGDTLMRQGRFREAEATLRDLLAELGAEPDADEAQVHQVQVALGQTLMFQGKLVEARELLEEVLIARSESLGDDHPSTILALASLASVLTNQRLFDDAEAAHRDALERARRVYGADNQQTLSIQNNLARCLGEMGRLDEAEAELRDCLERRRRVLGEEHIETLGTYNHLGAFLWDHGRVDEAAELILPAFETMRAALGEDDERTMQARFQVARLLSEQHRHREAAEHLGKIAARDREVLPEDSSDLPLALYNWAAKLQDAGDHPAAEAPLVEALELVERHGHHGEPFVPAARNGLAKVRAHQGRHAEADALFEAALKTRRDRHGAVHLEIAYSLSDWGEALLERGDFATAEPLLAELVRILPQLPGLDAWRLASARQLHGRCLTALGRHAEAEVLLLQACEALAHDPEALAGAARQARAGILALYAAWDAAEPGQGIGARAERWQAKFAAEE